MPRLFADVRFPTLRSAVIPNSVEIIRESFAHEVLVFTYFSSDFAAARVTSDVPVVVYWGHHPRYREVFIGYVNHVGVDTDRVKLRKRELIEVVCIGATRSLRDVFSKAWGTTRLDLVVNKIAQTAQIEADVDPTQIPHVGLMQHDMSNWAFIVKTAHEDGIHISTTGLRVHVWNQGLRRPELLRVAPMFDRARGNLLEFDSLAGTMIPENEFERKEAFGLVQGELEARASRPEVAQSIYSDRREPERYTKVVQGSFSSPRALSDHIESDRRDKGRIYKATAQLTPHPPLRPADVVVLLSNSPRYSGPWVVDKVVFRLQRQDLAMHAEISRENSSDSGQRPKVPFGATAYRKPVSARIAGGKWVPGGVL